MLGVLEATSVPQQIATSFWPELGILGATNVTNSLLPPDLAPSLASQRGAGSSKLRELSQHLLPVAFAMRWLPVWRAGQPRIYEHWPSLLSPAFAPSFGHRLCSLMECSHAARRAATSLSPQAFAPSFPTVCKALSEFLAAPGRCPQLCSQLGFPVGRSHPNEAACVLVQKA